MSRQACPNNSTVPPLGIAPDETWGERAITLAPGDTLVSFSDGLFDLIGGTTDAFTDIGAMVSGSSSCGHFIERVTALAAQEDALIDDVTVVAVRRDLATGEPR